MDPCPTTWGRVWPQRTASPGGESTPMAPAMALALEASFGSVQRWRDEFLALGKACGAKPGRVQLVFQPDRGLLVNQGVAAHPPVQADGVPLLALELSAPGRSAEAVAAIGAELDALLETLLSGIDWAAVHLRYQAAVQAASEAFGAGPDEIGGALLLDVRRAGAFQQAGRMLPGARWRDPAAVARWSTELPAGQAVVVYCVHGHEVSRATALRLRAAGLDARYLRGGIEGWPGA